MTLEGSFRVPALLRLGAGEMQFVADFVMNSGSLKAMAKDRGQSYPTIRNRLNDIIESLRDKETEPQDAASILDAVAQGKLSVEEATAQLKGAKR